MTLTVAYLRPRMVDGVFADSLAALMRANTYGLIARECGPDVAGGRNAVADEFLQGPGGWLLWLDADMVFAPDLARRLLGVAHPKKRPVVSALACVAPRGGHVHPNVYSFDPDTCQAWVDEGLPADQLVEVDATGLACTLIHRTVLERVTREFGPPFALDGTNGEDLSFMARVRALGIPVHVHTGIHAGHEKSATYWPEHHVPFRRTA